MTIRIGEKIKELRQKNNVTQEKLAEYIGVTAQAVSRWESGVCYPDMDLLPAIANFFDVTIDEMFSSNKSKNEKRIEEINELIHEKWNKGLVDEAIFILRNAIQEFPNNYDLLHKLAWLVHSKGRGKPGDEKQKDLQESISIYERILSDCQNESIRFGVIQKLAYAYDDIGEKKSC